MEGDALHVISQRPRRFTLVADHPLQAIVNQYWRQTWLTRGAPFPRPRRDWLLDLPDGDVTWHLMDASLPDLG